MEMAQETSGADHPRLCRESRPLPAPRRHAGQDSRPVPLPALQAAKVDSYHRIRGVGLKKAELRAARDSQTHIERLFSLRHRSRLDQLKLRLSRSAKPPAHRSPHAA